MSQLGLARDRSFAGPLEVSFIIQRQTIVEVTRHKSILKDVSVLSVLYEAITYRSPVTPNASIFGDELSAPESLSIWLLDTAFQVPDRATMIRELEQRKLRNTKASVAFGSAKVLQSDLQFRTSTRTSSDDPDVLVGACAVRRFDLLV